jgi:futalosine hydrolase
VLNIGIAGCRSGCGLAPGAVVLGRESVYDDLDPPRLGPTHLETDPKLLAAAQAALPEARVEVIGTSAAVGGTSAHPVEAMEGFGVLLAARQAGVPALELRVVSNEIEESDRALWQIDDALAILAEASVRLAVAIR